MSSVRLTAEPLPVRTSSTSLSQALILSAEPYDRTSLYASLSNFRPAYILVHVLIAHALSCLLCRASCCLIYDMLFSITSRLCNDCLNPFYAVLLIAGISSINTFILRPSEVVIVVLIPISIPISGLCFFISPPLLRYVVTAK